MACACKGRTKARFLWIPPEGSVDGEGTIEYPTEVQAKAKVMRKGGEYMTPEEFAKRAVEASLRR